MIAWYSSESCVVEVNHPHFVIPATVYSMVSISHNVYFYSIYLKEIASYIVTYLRYVLVSDIVIEGFFANIRWSNILKNVCGIFFFSIVLDEL